MWKEASILLMFAAGMTLVYVGLEKSVPALAAGLLGGRRRARATGEEARGETGGARDRGRLRGALIGVGLLLAGAFVLYGAFARLR